MRSSMTAQARLLLWGSATVRGDRRDESFGQDLEWRFSPIRHAVERGDSQYELIPIDEDEAERIVTRIRGLAASEE